MNKIVKLFSRFDLWIKVSIMGSLILGISFILTSFLFFMNYAYIPISIISFIPFAVLNTYLFEKQIDFSLKNGVRKLGVILLFITRYLVIIAPLAICTVLYFYFPLYFNPIVMSISLVIYQFSYKIVGSRFEVEND